MLVKVGNRAASADVPIVMHLKGFGSYMLLVDHSYVVPTISSIEWVV